MKIVEIFLFVIITSKCLLNYLNLIIIIRNRFASMFNIKFSGSLEWFFWSESEIAGPFEWIWMNFGIYQTHIKSRLVVINQLPHNSVKTIGAPYWQRMNHLYVQFVCHETENVSDCTRQPGAARPCLGAEDLKNASIYHVFVVNFKKI